MTVLVTNVGQLDARAMARADGFRVELIRDWKQAAARWHDINPSTPFQDPRWYDAWYGAFAGYVGIEPLIAVVTDAATGAQALMLPLIRRRQKKLTIIEFADLDLTDYNAPILGSAAPRDAAAARLLWRDLISELSRLPGGADLIRLRKLPTEFDGQANPLALLGDAGPCAANGNLVKTGEDYDAWRFSLEKTVRKELERSWRVFTRDPEAAFEIVTDLPAAMRILAATEVQQGMRMQSIGQTFTLNSDTYAAFYRNLVHANVGSGYALVSTLRVRDEVVATLLGIRRGSRYVMIRISNAGEKWSNCSPGRLIIERTMAALHKDGVRDFDFSTGNYAYKRRFGVKRLPLVDISVALTWRGWPHALRNRMAFKLRNYPRLGASLKRALGMPSSREEY